jgi:hypothetical protein
MELCKTERGSNDLSSISALWARLTRPSPLASAPSRSLRPAGMASCTRWHTSTSAQPTKPRATIVGRSTASGRLWRPSTGRGAAAHAGAGAGHCNRTDVSGLFGHIMRAPHCMRDDAPVIVRSAPCLSPMQSPYSTSRETQVERPEVDNHDV